MKLSAAIRTSIALKISLFAIGLTLFYYFDNAAVRLEELDYAPAIVADAVGPICAFAYAVAAGLAVWESGKLRLARVWDLSPSRSRYGIAFNVALPGLLLSWVMLLLPVLLSFIQSGIAPTVNGFRPLLQELVLCVAHTIIGFGAGLILPRLIAAPVVAILTYCLVAFSAATGSYWMRHVSGYYFEPLMFGELASFSALIPSVVFAGSVAIAVLIACSPLKATVVRVALAASLALGGTVWAHDMVRGRGPSLEVVSGTAPMQCAGASPEICMPTTYAEGLGEARTQALSVIKDLRAVGLEVSPTVITDRIADGRFQKSTTPVIWRVRLTEGLRNGDLRYQMLKAAVRFPCRNPDPVIGRAVILWAAKTVGAEADFAKELSGGRQAYNESEGPIAQIHALADEALALPRSQQLHWYQVHLARSCGAVT